MDEKDVLEVLRFYRHDLMNELQIIQGYLSMEMPDKAKTKMEAYIKALHEERKLMSLNAPAFALWLITFNSVHKQFRLTYSIPMEEYGDLGLWDRLLVQSCARLVDWLEQNVRQDELLHGHLQVMLSSAENAAEIELLMEGMDFGPDHFPLETSEGDDYLPVQTEPTVRGMTYTIAIPERHNGVTKKCF